MAKTVKDLCELLDLDRKTVPRGPHAGRFPGVQAVPKAVWRVPDEAFETLERGVYKPEVFIHTRKARTPAMSDEERRPEQPAIHIERVVQRGCHAG